ncbi:MAG: hypothetical protein ABS79_04100 [Planctomycetes bacterium SCN 63-9]|nr:MAG: hypothetical protein ABS79_04100 [Planctomycetes bacterium SCN 63-9]
MIHGSWSQGGMPKGFVAKLFLNLRHGSVFLAIVGLGIHLIPGNPSKPEESQARARLTGLTGLIRELMFDLQGKTLASIGWDGAIRLWNVEDACEISTQFPDEEIFFCLAFSPDGKVMATGDLEGIRLWDTTRHYEPIARWPAGMVRAVRFSPDGRSLLTSDLEKSIRIWDIAQQRVVAEFETPTIARIRMSFESDRPAIRYAIITSGLRAIVGRGGPGEIRPPSVQLPGDNYVAIAASEAVDRLFVVGRKSSIQTWNLADGTRENSFNVGFLISALVTSANGERLACGGIDGTLVIVEPSTQRILHSWREHASGISALAISADGRLAASAGGLGGRRHGNQDLGRIGRHAIPIDRACNVSQTRRVRKCRRGRRR